MTPQQIEAMKLALEALELINIEFVCGNGSHHKKEDRHEWDEDCPITNRWRKAITAIREALAQPEHEPVISKWVLREVYFDEDGEPISHRSPPQRTWVGLTDEDMADITSLPIGTCSMMLKVEAKLKEKNGV